MRDNKMTDSWLVDELDLLNNKEFGSRARDPQLEEIIEQTKAEIAEAFRAATIPPAEPAEAQQA